MGSFICKQPNGKYCRFSTVVDTLTHINMTEDEYIEYCVSRAVKDAIREAKLAFIQTMCKEMLSDEFIA